MAQTAPESCRLSEWISILPDNTITFVCPKSEMGQGACTGLAMIVAEELDVEWERVRIEFAPAEDVYRDPVFGIQLTGGSTSTRHMVDILRIAGAAAREKLLRAASDAWDVSMEECSTDRGSVFHGPSGRSLRYADLCDAASRRGADDEPAVKDPADYRLIGESLPKPDIPAKTDGSAIFGLDVTLPGLVTAVTAPPPRYGAQPVSMDEDAARSIDGVIGVVRLPDGPAVCAVGMEAALAGRDALNVQWSEGTHPELDDCSLRALHMERLSREGASARSDGDAERALRDSFRRLAATYYVPYLAHVPMEPINCVADVRPDCCEVHIPTQCQTAVLETACEETGLDGSQVAVRTVFLGGGFGRRGEVKVVQDAVRISKALGRPCKVVRTREDDIRHDFYRPATAARVEAGFTEDGLITAWRQINAGQSIFERVAPGMIDNGVDFSAVEGVADTHYAFPHMDVRFVRVDLPIPVGFWRSVGNSINAFIVESFLDEIAAEAGADPVDMRLRLLRDDPQCSRVVETVAERSGFYAAPKYGNGRGFAHHFSYGASTAQVIEVTVDEDSRRLKIERVVCAIDCGPVVHPDGIRAQLEGGICMGLGAALREAVRFEGGGVISSNYGDYRILSMSESPRIETHIVKSDAKMGGVGETAVPPAAPALANAVCDAVGIRARDLPLLPALETVWDSEA